MIFKKYQQFLGDFRIDENVQQAKIYLKKKALEVKKAKSNNDKEILNPDEQRRAENNPYFLKIKDLLRDNPGYVYAFTKFFFEEEVPMESLSEVYNDIKEYRSVIHNLPMTIDRYPDVVPDKADSRKGFERLGDDIEKLKKGRVVKKWVDRLYGEIKREYNSASAAMKEKVAGIAGAFDEFGKDTDGSKDEKISKELQDLFFNKVARYKNLNEVIQAALSYIKSANNSSMSKFFQNIQKVNVKYGEMNGAEIVYNENNVLVLEIKSFQANKELNSNTSHCIASSSHQWENYVGSDSNYNKQYYIYNFNLSPSDDKSIIGITIEPRGAIRACHTKSDSGYSSGIKGFLSNLKVPFEVLAPMTNEEIEKKKKRVIANKEIIKPNLTTKQAAQYIEEGADPNAQQGKPLINAVQEDNYEKTEFLLSKGASSNIGTPIKGAKNLKMIILLVENGATITNEIFASVADDYEAIKYLIDANMDVNFENGLPLRTVAKNGKLETVKLLIKHGADITTRRYMVIKWSAEWAQSEVLEYILSLLNPKDETIHKLSKEWIHWSKTSDKVDKVGQDRIDKATKVLEEFYKKGE